MAAKVSKVLQFLNLANFSLGRNVSIVGDELVRFIDLSNGSFFGSCAANQCSALKKIKGNQITGMGSLQLYNNEALEEVSVTDSSVTEFYVGNCPSVYSFDLSGNASLNLFEIDGVFSDEIEEFDAGGCALSLTSVNAILVALDACGASNGTCDLSGGTSSAPSGAGLTSKTNLEGKGWTVTVNE